MVRASASQSVDLGFVPLVESYQKTLKMVFTASLLGAQYLGEVVEKNPASLLVVSLGKALNATPPPLCKRQVAQFSLRIEGWWQPSDRKKQMPSNKNADICCGDP